MNIVNRQGSTWKGRTLESSVCKLRKTRPQSLARVHMTCQIRGKVHSQLVALSMGARKGLDVLVQTQH